MRRSLQPADGLVAAQAASAAALLWPGRARWSLPRVVGSLAGAALVGGTAFGTAGLRAVGADLTPFVDPRRGASLRTEGVFSLSRNPMYAGLVVAATGFAVLRRRPEPLVAAGALCAVLHAKAGIEEQRLVRRFGAAYTAYAARTPRVIGLPRNRPIREVSPGS